MDVEAHRKSFLAQLAKAPAVADVKPKAVADYAASSEHDVKALCDMIGALTLDPSSFRASVRTLLDIVGNDSLETAARLAALGQLKAAEFQPAEFAEFHAEFIALLRRLAQSPDRGMRVAAFERLTLTNDAHAQKLLHDGLEIGKPPVSTVKAIQFLARDDHGSAVPLFRRLAKATIGPVREQALRALAADTQSVALFESIANDKAEPTRLRQIAAMNLKNTSPTRFAKVATSLALDDQEDDGLRAVAVSAITHTSEVAAKVKPEFAASLLAVGVATGSRVLKASIDRYAKAVARKKS